MAQLRPTVGDERKFLGWFEGHRKAKRTAGADDPDMDSKYDWRGAYQADAQPDASGNWPNQFRRGK